MLHWIDTHGIESMLIYVAFLLLAGTIPPLPADAGFAAQWGYFIMKGLSANARGIGNAIGIKMPELQLASLPMMNGKKALPIENAPNSTDENNPKE